VPIILAHYAAFMALTLPVHYLLPSRVRNHWLLVVSCGFAWFLAREFAGCVLALTVVNFAVGRRLRGGGPWRRTILWAAIGANALALLSARYVFADRLRAGLGTPFAVLQGISYVVDVYTGRLDAPVGLPMLALYLVYFPKFQLGPIEPAHAFLPRLAEDRRWDRRRLRPALTMMVAGYARQRFIAEPLAAWVPSRAFVQPTVLEPGAAILGLVAWVFVYYNMFAGYTTFVRGMSELFGIPLSPNFAQPFSAATLGQFWRRWHMSFSQWLQSYVFLPLTRGLLRRSGGQPDAPSVILPPLLTMLLSALWNAMTVNVAVWGLLNGAWLVIERAVSLARPAMPNFLPVLWRRAGARPMTIAAALLLGVPFVMRLEPACAFWVSLFTVRGWALPDASALRFVLLSLALDYVQSRYGEDLSAIRVGLPGREASAAPSDPTATGDDRAARRDDLLT
jgi:D-alanyl-lipoteichoic acid acyltransferase DltB (MBOAT superfamily)